MIGKLGIDCYSGWGYYIVCCRSDLVGCGFCSCCITYFCSNRVIVLKRLGLEVDLLMVKCVG